MSGERRAALRGTFELVRRHRVVAVLLFLLVLGAGATWVVRSFPEDRDRIYWYSIVERAAVVAPQVAPGQRSDDVQIMHQMARIPSTGRSQCRRSAG